MWKAEAGVGGHWPPFPLGDNIPTTPLAPRIPAGGERVRVKGGQRGREGQEKAKQEGIYEEEEFGERKEEEEEG